MMRIAIRIAFCFVLFPLPPPIPYDASDAQLSTCLRDTTPSSLTHPPCCQHDPDGHLGHARIREHKGTLPHVDSHG
jgi:hypothetical protein